MKPLTAAWVGAVAGCARAAEHVARRVAGIARSARGARIQRPHEVGVGRDGGDLLRVGGALERRAGATGGALRRQDEHGRVARAQRAGLRERRHELRVPHRDALDELPAIGDELAAVDAHVAVELDAPQLGVHPLGQVLHATGVHASLARGPAGRGGQPLAGGRPAHAGEGTDAAVAQELVGDHPARSACQRRKIVSRGAGCAGSAGSSPSRASRPSVLRIWSV